MLSHYDKSANVGCRLSEKHPCLACQASMVIKISIGAGSGSCYLVEQPAIFLVHQIG